MRMWMIDPKYMCNKHLLAEHHELHMFLGLLKRKTSINRYIENNLIEPKSIYTRHEQLEKEMRKRYRNSRVLNNFQHSTPISKKEAEDAIKYLSEEQKNYTINTTESSKELKKRCSLCFNRTK